MTKRLLAACALALCLHSPAAANAYDCAWLRLTTADRVRLELDALTGGTPLKTVYDRFGEQGFAALLSACKIALEQQNIIVLGHYFGARASAEATEARLMALGFSKDELTDALSSAVKPQGRVKLAEGVLAFKGDAVASTEATTAVRKITEKLKASGSARGAQDDIESLAKLWAFNRILADGVAAGARPPSP